MTNDVSWVFDELKIELAKATKNFPPMKSPHEGWAILKEEVDEMWDEIKRNDFDGALEEALQVAAMAVRYIHDLQDYTPPKSATVRPFKGELLDTHALGSIYNRPSRAGGPNMTLYHGES